MVEILTYFGVKSHREESHSWLFFVFENFQRARVVFLRASHTEAECRLPDSDMPANMYLAKPLPASIAREHFSVHASLPLLDMLTVLRGQHAGTYLNKFHATSSLPINVSRDRNGDDGPAASKYAPGRNSADSQRIGTVLLHTDTSIQTLSRRGIAAQPETFEIQVVE